MVKTRKPAGTPDEQLAIACLMRYRSYPVKSFDWSWASYKLISEATGISPTAVRVMLNKYQA